MRISTFAPALGLAAALLVPAALEAQQRPASTTQRTASSSASSSSATPFRARQWGTEFAASDDFQSLGMLRFFSSTRALAFDARFSNAANNVEDSEAKQSATTFGLSAGYRMYRGISSGVVGYATAGGLITSIGTSSTNGAGARTETTVRGFGPFAEVGAAYFVTRNLSLGAAYGVQFLKTSSKTEAAGGTTESSGHTFGSSPLSVRISLYF